MKKISLLVPGYISMHGCEIKMEKEDVWDRGTGLEANSVFVETVCGTDFFQL